jgi:hypothetical protein
MGKNSLDETDILHHVLPSWLEIVGGAQLLWMSHISISN